MIQLAAPPASTSTAPPPGPMAGQYAGMPAEATGNGAFSQVLSLFQVSVVAAPEMGEGPAGEPAGRHGLAVTEAASGKILPQGALGLRGAVHGVSAALKFVVAAGTPVAPEQSVGETDEVRLHPAAQGMPGLLAAVRAIRLPVDVAATLPDDGAEKAEVPAAAEAAVAVPALPAAPAMVPAPAAEPVREQAQAQTGGTTLPPLIDAQLRGLPLTAAKNAPAKRLDKTAQEGRTAEAIRMLPVSAMRPDVAPAGFTLNDEMGPQVGNAVRLHAGLGDMTKGAATAAAELAVPAVAGFAPPVSADTSGSAIGAGSVAGPVAAPQDFGALVDRLIEARDAVRPAGVDVSINHAEFGPVSLRFRQDGEGLSVSVASADPDFARAVQAAVPAPAASSGADGAGQNSQGYSAQGFVRQDSASGQGGGQNGGQQASTPAAQRRAEAGRGADGTAQDTTANAPATGRGRFA